MSKYTWRKHDVEELHNSDDLQEISKLAHLAIIRLRDALWRRDGKPIKPGAIPTSILYERAEWESVIHEVRPFFDWDDTGIFCREILEQVGRAQEVRQARSRAGKASAQVRNEHMPNKCSTYVQQDVQQRRGEERRIEEIREESNTPSNLDVSSGKTKPKKESKRFVKPSLEQVREYMTEIGVGDPKTQSEAFYDRNETTGWVVGKNQMKDWRAAVRTWKRNGEIYGYGRRREPAHNSIADARAQRAFENGWGPLP